MQRINMIKKSNPGTKHKLQRQKTKENYPLITQHESLTK